MTDPRPADPDQPDEDALTPEQVERLKYEIWSTPTLETFADAPPRARLVAEGDSWFDYPPGLDLLDQLKRNHGYEIFKVAQAGDSLENMVYGTEVSDNFSRKTPPIRATLAAIREYQPSVLLFSGGGNDIAGPELEALVNHKDSGLPVLRADYIEYLYAQVAKGAYRELIRLATEAKPDIQIIAHGYAEPVPDGRPVRVIGIRFAGPWLRPALTKKNVVKADEARDVMRQLIARFNQMLAELAIEHRNFHYVDVRGEIGPDDWVNELHPKNSAFRRAAARIHARVQEVTEAVVT
jgi:hypothetical protein